MLKGVGGSRGIGGGSLRGEGMRPIGRFRPMPQPTSPTPPGSVDHAQRMTNPNEAITTTNLNLNPGANLSPVLPTYPTLPSVAPQARPENPQGLARLNYFNPNNRY